MSALSGRILYLLNDAPFFVSHRLSLAQAAIRQGAEVHVAAPFDPQAVPLITQAGATFHPIPLRRGGQNVLGEARLGLAFYRLIRTVRPDLVHAITMKPVIYGGAAARLARAPAAVFSVTGLGHLFLTGSLKTRILRRLVMALFRYALHHPNGRTIFQNADDQSLFERARAIDPRTAVLIPGTGVDLEQFQPSDATGDTPVALFPARLIGEKGVHEFVDAARRLSRDGINARFVLAGRLDPENPSHVSAATVAEWVREGCVEHWGFSDDMPATLRQADIVCLPSYREGSPRSLIEALAAGLPIVTTDTTGCRDLVPDGANGILVPVKDSPATAAALAKLLGDPALRAQMGRASRKLAEQEYGVEEFVERTFAVYRDVLNSPPEAT